MKRTLRIGSVAVELASRGDAGQERIHFGRSEEAARFLRRFGTRGENVAALRGFVAASSAGLGVWRWTDDEVVDHVARMLAGGRAELLRLPAPTLRPLKLREQEAPPPSRQAEKLVEKTWIEIVLLDMEGKPVAGAPYSVTLSDGTVKEGRLSAKGRAFFDDIDPGQCLVRFPQLDEGSTDRVGGGAQRAADASAGSPTGGSFQTASRAAAAAAKTWVEIALVDDTGAPLGGQPYWIQLTDGSVQEGTLDASGKAYFDDLDAGECQVHFPELDGGATERVGGGAQRAGKSSATASAGGAFAAAAGAGTRLGMDKTWIEIALVDETGAPVPGERYSVVLADGSLREGTLDDTGRAYFDDIDPGTCRVRFPNLDQDVLGPPGA